ncbi:methyl-accepting chemotaxis protein [Balneatrix alpica]|uniref:Methyl-accepting chemotaxis protein n=1 Tax=Balneatrix alpica TaxID=75684 RepID=A0ABV5Z9F0_9GAMM|nr:methyl-accepting chemotaxis protein [Balneatrix alpica]
MSLFRPAAALMARLSYPQKFGLIALLFLAPLMMTLMAYLGLINSSISRSQQEQLGMLWLQELAPITVLTGQHRGLNNALMHGNEAVRAQVEDKRKQLSSQLNTLQGQQHSLPTAIATEVQALNQSWQNLQAKLSQESPAQIFERHNRLAAQIRALNGRLIRYYGLAQDPDAGMTFLISQTGVTLPTLVDLLGQLRGKASGVAAAGSFTPESQLYISGLMIRIEDLLPQLRQLEELPQQSFAGQAELGARLMQANQAAMTYVAQIDQQLLQASSISVASTAVFDEGTRTITAIMEAYQQALPLLAQQLEQRLSAQQWQRGLAVTMTLLGVLIAVYLFGGFYRNTTRTLASFVSSARRLAAGDLSHTMEVTTRDEMRRLGEGLNEVTLGMRKLVQEVRASAEVVHQAAAELGTGAASTLQGVQAQKQDTESLAAAMEEMSASARDVVNHTAVAAETALEANGLSRQGHQVASKTVVAVEGLSQEVSRSAETIQALAQAVENIGKVSSVIREIAEQTNLLALNAAIEAARAGEQGRGFAVVADEVRNLAQRTQQSTAEIQQTISHLQQGTEQAVEVMQLSRSSAERSAADIQQTGTTLASINERVERMNAMNEQIDQAAKQQASVADDLSGNISSISANAEQTAVVARQTAALAKDLQERASGLNELMLRFKL